MERLRAEQQELIAKHGEGVTKAVLDQMTYADAVIRETQMVYPSAPVGFRYGGRDLCV